MSQVAKVDLYKQYKLNKNRISIRNNNLKEFCDEELNKIKLNKIDLEKINIAYYNGNFELVYDLITKYKLKTTNNINVVKVEELEKYILSYITKEEYIIFSNILEKLKKLSINLNNIDFELDNIKKEFDPSFQKKLS